MTPHAPTPEKPARIFRDVSKVAAEVATRRSPSPALVGPDAPAEDSNPTSQPAPTASQPPATDHTPPGGRLRKPTLETVDAVNIEPEEQIELDQDLSIDTLLDQAKIPWPAHPADAPGGPEEAQPDEQPQTAPAQRPPERSGIVNPIPTSTPEPSPDPAQTPDSAHAKRDAPPLELRHPKKPRPAPPQPPYTVRVDDEEHPSLTVAQLAELVRKGVWTEVVELRLDDGSWVPIATQDAVMLALRGHLADHAKAALQNLQVDTGSDEPPPRALAGESTTSSPPAAKSQAAPTAPSEPSPLQAQPRPRARVWLVGLLLLALSGLALLHPARGLLWATMDGLESQPPTPTSSHPSFDAAHLALHNALRPTPMVEALIDAGHHKAARHLAIDALASGADDDALKGAFDRAVTDDPRLAYRVQTLGEDLPIDRVFAMGGGRSLSFRLTNQGQTLYAFKPQQADWGLGWRSEIAAYRLCEVIVCQFAIPHSQPARISRATFEELYGLVNTYRQDRYARRFDELTWQRAPGPDGEPTEYLYGVLEDWVPKFVRWPIEHTSIWESWLDVRYHPDVLDRPLVEQLAPLEQTTSAGAYAEILGARGAADTRDVARQLSSMLLVDFLISNWDRFSRVEEFYGVNNQFADGRFVSIDMGAAFHYQPIDRVASRFDRASRFSARTVASLRAINPDTLNPLLFPDPQGRESYRLALFWTQLDRALHRIDSLIEQHGRDRVLEFE